MTTRRRRVIFRIVAAFALGLVIALAALPVWFPWIARPVAKSLGITYTDFQRDGYARFHVSNLVLRAKSGVFKAKRGGAFVPTAWLWRMAFGTNAAPFLTASAWEFSFQQNSNAPASSSSVFTNVAKLNDTFKTLERWLPKAEFTNGVIRANDIQVAIPDAIWKNGALAAKLVLPRNRPFTLNADWPANASLKISLASAPLNFQTELSLAKTNSNSVQLSANGIWSSNRFEIAAEFPKRGWIPESATARADSFQIPASFVKLGDYEKITGSLDGDWNGARFTMNLIARAIPKSAALPEWNIEARASGDTNSVTIDSAKITAPWLNAKLSEGARVRFAPPFLIQPARLDVSANLARQSWFDASGILRGTALFRPGTNEYPHIGFALNGNGVTVSNFQSRTLQLNGEFNWPRIKLSSTRIVTTNGSEAVLSGTFNVPEKNIERGEVNFSGALGSKLLPAGYSFRNANLNAQFSGPLSAISHSGKLDAENVVIPNGKPMNVNASWNGLGLNLNQATVSLSTSNAMLGFRGALKTSRDGAEISISEMSLQSSNNAVIKLEKPFQIAFQKLGTNNPTENWKLQIQPAHWIGDGRDLDLQADVYWPERGSFRVAARGLTTDLLKQFLKLPDANVTLQNFALTGGWTNGPISFSLNSLAEIAANPRHTFSAKADLIGGGGGISIRQLSVSSATQMVCHAEGALPFIFQPTAHGDVLRIDANRPLALRAFTETNSLLWSQLAEISGVRLSDPLLSANVSGTWSQPQGAIAMSATSIEFPGEVRRLPKIQDLALNVKLNRDEISLSRFQAFVEDQPIRATANMPLGDGFWTALLHGRRKFDWREVNAEIEMSNAQIAPFTAFVPDILAPQGEFSVKLGLKRGGKLSGEMDFENVTTRPLATLGPMRNVHATALLANDRITLTNAAANIGGQPIRLHGGVQLGENFWQNKSLPPFQLYVRGTNVPLVRQANVLVRADLNIAITNNMATNAIVAGTVKLRDSFFLSNLKDLAPGKVAAPERRPPYVSVEAEPFANWRLALQVTGEKFLKVRSPLFRGVVSTTMQLEGTLKEPLALGEARINSGNVTFPFGSLTVQQGFVSLTSANPYHPQLFVNATAQRLGYDIKMEATGPADQPIVQFSSSPPLSSEDIVLMLTTGRSPQGIASAGTRQRAQGIAVFVGKNLLSEFGIGGGGEDRLTVRSGEQVTEAGKPTYEVEYKLTDDWSLVGEYDRFGDYNAGLKWRVYSR